MTAIREAQLESTDDLLSNEFSLTNNARRGQHVAVYFGIKS